MVYVRSLVSQLEGYVRHLEGDEDSIDMVVARHGYYSEEKKRKIAESSIKLQLKCTADRFSPSRKHPDRFAKSIPAKNYGDLTALEGSVRHLLVVVQCPANQEDRVRWSDRAVRLRGKAWWVDLAQDYELPGHGPLKPGQQDKTVYVPFNQRLTAASLAANIRS